MLVGFGESDVGLPDTSHDHSRVVAYVAVSKPLRDVAAGGPTYPLGGELVRYAAASAVYDEIVRKAVKESSIVSGQDAARIAACASIEQFQSDRRPRLGNRPGQS